MGKLLELSDLATDSKFSMQKVESAAKSFLKFQSERGQWIAEDSLEKYFKGCWSAGKFIREHFGFNDWIKYSYSYLYNRKSIERLADELKKRNVDLQRYTEYVASQALFQKKMDEFFEKKKGRYAYLLPDDLADIQTTDVPKPDVKLVQDDITELRKEFDEFKMIEFIDVYKGHYAVLKTDYSFYKYRDSELIDRCKKWCHNFNYANEALKLLTNRNVKFNPIKDEDMLEL
ncbi:hypothetical protein [Arachidicoccus terrestris]|uniref:hypothetical protein n=1 Tax=Arachidicoccus terrestris TaxID=2875539 RepID=UPI001CC459BC|nr:hypothetical protein [Arachidicoccus terrestris]UAY55667.1 hypothetical protein K9M52_01145 [Arachidicoccus terrestris]